MTDEPTSTPTIRSLLRDGRRAFVVLGQKRGGLTDLYHGLLTIPLWGLLLVVAAAFLVLNLVFATAFIAVPSSIQGARPGQFSDAFFFSVETFTTIGYGAMSPHGLYGEWVMVTEAFCGLISAAVITGLVFARVSRPTARVMFSRYAVITNYEGAPTLMIRAANQRGNQILEAEATVNLARQLTTIEGHVMRSFFELPVIRGRSPLFLLSWTIMHRIDETSPLYGLDEAAMQAQLTEIIVVLSGVDETFAQRIHARHAYSPETILWNQRFEDILSIAPDGRRVVDYRKFHDVRDNPPLAPH